jgi:hypothetical protein
MKLRITTIATTTTNSDSKKNFFYEKYYDFTVINVSHDSHVFLIKMSLSELQRRNLIVKFCL